MNSLKSRFERQADDFLSKMQQGFHPNAWKVLSIDGAAVRQWLIKRFEVLNLSLDAQVGCKINDYNNSHKLGIQSAQVLAPALLPGEIKAPTIGVITEGLLKEKGELSIVDFPIDEGSEYVQSLSEGGILLQSAENGSELIPLQPLECGQIALAESGRQVIRVVLERPKDASEKLFKPEVQGYRNGVYACTYLENIPE